MTARNPTDDALPPDGIDSSNPADWPPMPETRAIRYGIRQNATPQSIRADLNRLARCGFNTVIVSAFRHGYTAYPSEAMARAGLPAIHPAFRKRDMLSELFKRAETLGLSIWGRIELLNVGSDLLTGQGPILNRYPEWTLRKRPWFSKLVGDDRERYFLNPAHPAARRLIGDVAHELTERYPFVGIYLNDLRYPRSLNQPTANRQARDLNAFAEQMEPPISPDRIKTMLHGKQDDETKALLEQLAAWRSQQLDETLRYLHCRMTRGCSRIWLVSQAVGAYDVEEAQNNLQGDWVRWLTQQYLDGATPYYKGMSDEDFERALSADVAAIPDDRALYPLLDKTDLTGESKRIDIIRSLPIYGFVFRSFHSLEDEEWALLGKALRRPAKPIEISPYQSARLALEESIRILTKQSDISAFFTDLLKLIPANGDRVDRLSGAQTRSIGKNLINIERKIADGEIRLENEDRRAVRWMALARKCLLLGRRF